MNSNVAGMGKVAVLMGGWSAEREVSLMSGAGVLAALRAGGVDAHAFDPAERPLSDLTAAGFSRCFNATYRDYMDRFRYYADARGTDLTLWIRYSFGKR